MTSVLENMKRSSDKLFDAYNRWDVDAMLAIRSKDCKSSALPKSFGKTIGCVEESNTKHRERLESMNPVLRDFKFTIKKSIHDTDARQSSFHVTSFARSPIGPYENEYAFFVSFNDSGEEVTETLEFVDSAYTTAWMERLASCIAEHGGDVEAAWKASESAK